MGSFEEVHEAIEADDEGDENTHPSPAQSSDPMASSGTAKIFETVHPQQMPRSQVWNLSHPQRLLRKISYTLSSLLM